jgi:hypothetical protein
MIYKDIFSGDELCSDVYPVSVVHGCMLQFVGSQVNKDKGGNYVGIDGNNDEDDDAPLDQAQNVTVINIVDAHCLTKTDFDKKSFMSYIKSYLKKLLDKIKENGGNGEVFQKEAQAFVKDVLAHFKDYDFYMGSSQDAEAMIILCKWGEDGVTPYFFLWKDGLINEKV